MSANKKSVGNPFLKKASGAKPPTRSAIKAQQKRGGLGSVGRGLDALVTRQAAETAPAVAAVAPVAVAPKAVETVAPTAPVAETDSILHVPPLDIERSPYQPRTEFKAEALEELAASIKANGIIQPLTCRRRGDGKLELICGERRLRASVIAGVKLVPVTVKEVDDATAATMTVTENAQRDDLNPIDEAEGYRTLIEKFGLTQSEVAERVGKSRPVVANSTRLLDLPDDVQDLLRKNAITTGHAKVLLTLQNPQDVRRFAQECAPVPDPRTGKPVGGLTVRELERRIARFHRPVVERIEGTPDIPPAYVRALTEELHKVLGCAVRLRSGVTHANGRHTKGMMEIDFSDNNDLDRVLAMLGVKMD